MQNAAEIDSDGHSVLGLARLLVIPAIALVLMLTLTLDSAAQPNTPAHGVRLEPSRRLVDESNTLYIYSSDTAQSAAPDDQPWSQSAGMPGRPGRDSYTRVDTPEEEAAVMRIWEHANWIRYDSGLPRIPVVDLRPR